ncbi:MAG: YceI family protein [Flavobacteriales bacterium]|nr:YceI family protein [Flavobacteriales bacterium]
MSKLNNSLMLGAMASVLMLASCGTAEAPATDNANVDSAATAAFTLTVDPAVSAVNWSGSMIGVKTHTGKLNFTKGELALGGNQVTGGSFTVDMRSYLLTDTNYAADGSPQGTREKLMGHLMSPDFFAVDSFPTAEFVITKVEGNTATGNLTVRGRTHEEKVTNIVVTQEGSNVSAIGDLTFNRQKYGVSWKAPMKDLILSDDIVLKVELKGTKA